MKDEVIQEGSWQFNEEVTKVFEDMLSRSIPDYENMRRAVYKMGRNYIQPNTEIIDIGCSNGLSIRDFVQNHPNNTYTLIDVSEPMLQACRQQYDAEIRQGIVNVLNHDLRKGLPPRRASLILSVLTLQFTPIEYRHRIVQSIYDTLEPNGAFILVEKVLGSTYDIDSILVKEYYDMKSDNQYTQEQIMSKRKSLEGTLVPITSHWNEEILRNCGFRHIQCL